MTSNPDAWSARARRRPGARVGRCADGRLLARIAACILVCGLSVGGAPTADAQEPDAWRTIVVRDSVRIAYLFYPDADGRDGGVVVLLRNAADRRRCVSFDLEFHAGGSERAARVARCLAPGEGATGEPDGLFWIPFDDRRTLEALVLRRLRVSACPDGAACAPP